MNVALIIAGGSGQRMHQDIPKQFINIENKPVIIYTLEAFQAHPCIDAIEISCLSGWTEILRAYAKQFNITKLTGIVEGGRNGQESIYNGLVHIAKRFHEDDIILIHDAIRPMVSEEIISDCIRICSEYGSAVSAVSCNTVMLTTEDQVRTEECYDRDKLMSSQTPQGFPLKKLLWAHEEAKRRGITNSVATCSLMVELGEQLYFSVGSEKNIKLTTTDDVEIFRALLRTGKISWMKD